MVLQTFNPTSIPHYLKFTHSQPNARYVFATLPDHSPFSTTAIKINVVLVTVYFPIVLASLVGEK